MSSNLLILYLIFHSFAWCAEIVVKFLLAIISDFIPLLNISPEFTAVVRTSFMLLLLLYHDSGNHHGLNLNFLNNPNKYFLVQLINFPFHLCLNILSDLTVHILRCQVLLIRYQYCFSFYYNYFRKYPKKMLY